MKKIELNGYIDDVSWFGDEITPDGLHDMLYPKNGDEAEDVDIVLNSYGGSCNAAVRMYDDMKRYPGKIAVTISGTAASAATVLCQAADRLTMTPGSLFMIHDPSTIAMGNEQDFEEAIACLKACKESIINVYQTRSNTERKEIAKMMKNTTWMDANEALEKGFIDAIAEAAKDGITDAAFAHVTNRQDAEKGVNEWMERHKNPMIDRNRKVEEVKDETEEPVVNENAEPAVETIDENRVPVGDRQRRLEELRHY